MAGAWTGGWLLGLVGGLCCAAFSFARTLEAPARGAGASARAPQHPVPCLFFVPLQDDGRA